MREATPEQIERDAAEELRRLELTGRLSRPYSVYKSPAPDLKQLRELLRCSQSEFADRFGLSLRTVQQWEQGRAEPDQPARVLLTAIETEPNAIARAASIAIRRAQRSSSPVVHNHLKVDAIAVTPGQTMIQASEPYSKVPKLGNSVRRDPNRDKKFAHNAKGS